MMRMIGVMAVVVGVVVMPAERKEVRVMEMMRVIHWCH